MGSNACSLFVFFLNSGFSQVTVFTLYDIVSTIYTYKANPRLGYIAENIMK